MKKLNQVTLVMLMIIFAVSNSFATEKDVRDKIDNYLIVSGQKETKDLEIFVSEDANFTNINGIVGKKEVLNKEAYLKFVKEGKASAWATRTKVKSVSLNGDLAVACLEADAKNLIRRECLTLALVKGNWELVSSIAILSKK